MMLLNRAPPRESKLNQSSFQIALVFASLANMLTILGEMI
jgi:hypothetical protein